MKNRHLLTIIFFVLIAFQVIAQETVFVESTQKGKGILKSRSGECFVITPEHVVREDISELSIIGSKNVLSNGKLVQAMEGIDLAIIRVTGGGAQNCTNWSVPNNYNSILDNTAEAYLELRDENGGTQLIQVFINGKDEEMISIVPKLSNDIFIKGMSGGSLFTQHKGEKVYLGMLQEIGEDGEGYVFQADDMERILGGFFGDSQKQSSIKSMTTKTAEPSANSVEEEGYRFDLIEVKKSGTTVICKLRLTSLEKDSSIRIFGERGSKIYDDNGLETIASNVKLGNESGIAWIGDSYTLVKGIPVPLELKFKDVNPEANGISLLNIKANRSDIKFKNISFKGLNEKLEISILENIQYSQEAEGFKFDLIDVKKSGTTVVCKLKLTSLEKDSSLRIFGERGSKIYDDNGVETIASNVKLGNESAIAWIGDSYTLVKGIPVPLELKFKDVNPEANGISLLKIKANRSDIKFKNISFKGLNEKLEISNFENIQYSQEAEGFKFDLIDVKKSGTTVICKLRLTSLEKDSSLRIFGERGSKIYDENGSETKASSIKLGNESGIAWIGDSYTLVKGIPVPLELKFKDVNSEANGLSLLNIKANRFDIKFKNILFN